MVDTSSGRETEVQLRGGRVGETRTFPLRRPVETEERTTLVSSDLLRSSHFAINKDQDPKTLKRDGKGERGSVTNLGGDRDTRRLWDWSGNTYSLTNELGPKSDKGCRWVDFRILYFVLFSSM